jgi:phosphoribosyl-AMP cyclohydrolase
MLRFHSPLPIGVPKRSFNDNVVILPVENINLSVNYYKEYLGFTLVANNDNDNALLQIGNQEIILEQVVSPDKIYNSEIVLNLNWDETKLKQHYYELRQKVKVKKNYSGNQNGVSLFSTIDCDGNILNFQVKVINAN